MSTWTPVNNIPQHSSDQRANGTESKPLLDVVADFDKRCGDLCFALFEVNPMGKELLTMWEQHFFYSPVAMPGMNEHAPYYLDGQNNFIRQIRKWCKSVTKDPASKPAQIVREVNHG